MANQSEIASRKGSGSRRHEACFIVDTFIIVCESGDRSIPFRRRESKQLSKARFIRFARRTITIGLNPFWMFDPQGVMYLSLKFKIRADLIQSARKSLCFHDSKIGSDPIVAISRTQDF
jgi:hypothetical protein